MRKKTLKKSYRKKYSKKNLSKKKYSKKNLKQKGGSVISTSIIVSLVLGLVGLGIYNKNEIIKLINKTCKTDGLDKIHASDLDQTLSEVDTEDIKDIDDDDDDDESTLDTDSVILESNKRKEDNANTFI